MLSSSCLCLLLFLCCLLLPWALNVPAFDSLFHFTWLLLICCHLRKTHFIKIVYRIVINTLSKDQETSNLSKAHEL